MKAVAYIRVSTKSDAQLHSYEYQLEYWQNEINDKYDYEFTGIYADWGISGRSLEKRPQLLKLIEDAKKKEFDIVFTKSVSRFGRNTTELLETVRLLRDLGIKVIFEKEQIDSFNPSAEVYLSIAAAVAENDLKIYSENMHWSIKNRFKNGYIMVGSGMLGYKLNNETNSLEIVEEEAKLVRYIYDLYLNGMGINLIARTLNNQGVKSPRDNKPWCINSVRYVLSNEKYKGCNLSQKTYSINGIKNLNRGSHKMYYSEQTHPAIIEPEVYDKVQKLIRERATESQVGKYGPKVLYPFTKKIVCGKCGACYNHKINNTNKPWRTSIWICCTKSVHTSSVCDNHNIKDAVLREKFVEAYNEFITTRPVSDVEQEHKEELENYIKQEIDLKALKVNHLIELEDYEKESKKVREQIKEINIKLSELAIRGVREEDYNPIMTFDEDKVNKFIEKVVILDNTMTFIFTNGVEITKTYSNGIAGNSKGWKERKKLNGNN